jgi:hypothetical protein
MKRLMLLAALAGWRAAANSLRLEGYRILFTREGQALQAMVALGRGRMVTTRSRSWTGCS